MAYLSVWAALPVSASISDFRSSTNVSHAVVSSNGFVVSSLSSMTTQTEASKESISSGMRLFLGISCRATPFIKSRYRKVSAPNTGAEAGLAAGEGTHLEMKYRMTWALFLGLMELEVKMRASS